MGWCSATGIFDSVLDAALPHITDKAARERFVYLVAVPLWEGDWDCEDDSDYYEEFSHILDARYGDDQPWTKDPATVAWFPPVKHYRKTYLTPAVEWTGHNFDDVRKFCEGDGAVVWGLAGSDKVYGTTATKFTMNEVCVYDYLHKAWIPFSVGDHIAKGPAGENYPIQSDAMRATYVEVALT